MPADHSRSRGGPGGEELPAGCGGGGADLAHRGSSQDIDVMVGDLQALRPVGELRQGLSAAREETMWIESSNGNLPNLRGHEAESLLILMSM